MLQMVCLEVFILFCLSAAIITEGDIGGSLIAWQCPPHKLSSCRISSDGGIKKFHLFVKRENSTLKHFWLREP